MGTLPRDVTPLDYTHSNRSSIQVETCVSTTPSEEVVVGLFDRRGVLDFVYSPINSPIHMS